MAIPGLEVIQSSASLRGTGSGLRQGPNVAKLIAGAPNGLCFCWCCA